MVVGRVVGDAVLIHEMEIGGIGTSELAQTVVSCSEVNEPTREMTCQPFLSFVHDGRVPKSGHCWQCM